MFYTRFFFLFLLVFLSGCCCAGVDSNSSIKEGSIAPGFSLKDPDGKTFDLGRLKGKVLFLNFWRSG